MSLFGVHFDPEMNPDPLSFDIEPKNVQHFAFGGGAHYCLGAGLGKAQAKDCAANAIQSLSRSGLRSRPRGQAQGCPGF
ncbi:MAG: cytochrome P450 [Sphingomonadales bacterium]|nr:cytochrome P450 [Sphingomonadales bacterium]